MFLLIQHMPQDEMAALAEHFSQKPWPKLNQPRASEAETKRAQAAIVTGQCVACHGILGMGDGTNPRIAGQSRGYMLKTLQEFQSKARGNNPWMSDILGPLHPDDLGCARRVHGRPLTLGGGASVFGIGNITGRSIINQEG